MILEKEVTMHDIACRLNILLPEEGFIIRTATVDNERVIFIAAKSETLK